MIALLKRMFGEQLPAMGHPLTDPITCPKCSGAMTLTLLTPLLFGGEHETATYTCAKCGHETARTVQRNNS